MKKKDTRHTLTHPTKMSKDTQAHKRNHNLTRKQQRQKIQ